MIIKSDKVNPPKCWDFKMKKKSLLKVLFLKMLLLKPKVKLKVAKIRKNTHTFLLFVQPIQAAKTA